MIGLPGTLVQESAGDADALPPPQWSASYQVAHETHVAYERSVTLSQQFLHMSPRPFHHQQVLSHQVTVEPAPHERTANTDYFGNPTLSLLLSTPHRELTVRAESRLAVALRPQLPQLAGSMRWETLRDRLRTPADAAMRDATQFLYDSPHVVCSAELARYALPSFPAGRPVLEAAQGLMARIHSDFEFDPAATTIATPLEAVLKGRRGVCQDFAHLMTGCLRSLGLACCYVSGYILTTPPAGQPRMVGADASHAWVSVFCPLRGWVDFDPTNRCLVQTEHLTLGWGRDFSDVTPMRGIVLGGGEQELTVRVTVTPVTLQARLEQADG